MNIHLSTVLLSLSLLLHFSESAQCPGSLPYRCGSSWSDANTKCGQCCFSRDDCSISTDNCYAHLDPAPCDGSPITSAPTSSTPSPVTPLTPSPVTSQVTAAPTDATSSSTQNTPAPTNITPSPTNITPAPVGNPVSCNNRCGAGWADANTKCGECCTTWDSCSASSENCFGGLDTSPCASQPTLQPTQSTASPVPVPTTTTAAPAPTTSTAAPPPTDGNVIGNYRLAAISGCGSGKYVSLTFDDGPAEQNDATLRIINTLNSHGIVATFYVSPAAWGEDQWGLDLRCELIQQLTASGNEIQSHSWKHPNFQQTQLTNDQIRTELETTSDFIVGCGGIAPTIFRPPYGALNKQQAEYIVGTLRYIIGMWNLDSNDWRSPNDFTSIAANIDLTKFNGDSVNILMHDRNVYDIVDQIITLFQNGYQFITQSECFRRCDTMDADGVCMDTHGNNLYIINEWR